MSREGITRSYRAYTTMQWIVDIYDYLRNQPEITINDFRAAGISEAVDSAQSVVQRIENPFITNL